MSAKHTPGPWGVEYGLSSDPAAYTPGIDAIGQDFTVILYGIKAEGEACGIRGRNVEEQEANARLIAAAPELLEALQAMLEQFNYSTVAGLVHDESMAIMKAREAFAKATGSEA